MNQLKDMQHFQTFSLYISKSFRHKHLTNLSKMFLFFSPALTCIFIFHGKTFSAGVTNYLHVVLTVLLMKNIFQMASDLD